MKTVIKCSFTVLTILSSAMAFGSMTTCEVRCRSVEQVILDKVETDLYAAKLDQKCAGLGGHVIEENYGYSSNLLCVKEEEHETTFRRQSYGSEDQFSKYQAQSGARRECEDLICGPNTIGRWCGFQNQHQRFAWVVGENCY